MTSTKWLKDVAEVKQLLQQLLEETSVGDEVGSGESVLKAEPQLNLD